MSSKPIPERQPVGDTFRGIVLQVANHQALALAPQAKAETIAEGNFMVRYGLRYLGKSYLSIVPGLVVLDYGDYLTGEEAWSFLTEGSNLYPRSEVVGYRNDGEDEIIVIKALDIDIPPEVLVYQDASATVPIAKPSAIIVRPDRDLPPRLLEFLPRFSSIEEWLTIL